MALKRSTRMELVLRLARQAEDGAAQALQTARQQVLQAEQQCEKIEQYQQEYIRDLNQLQVRCSVHSMMNDRRFLAQLVDIGDSQQGQLAQYRQNEDNCLNNWQLCYQRRKSVEQLIAKLKLGEHQVLEKQLQKELDELSSLVRPSDT